MQVTLNKLFPFLQWWPMVNRQTLRADILAGLTGAIIVLPQGVAFAMIAGMPPIYGLYTAMVTPIVAALFGSSWHLISGPTTAISIVVFSTLSGFADPGSPEFIQMALALTFLAGAFQLGMGLARFGTLVNFVSHSVVVGFTAGAALLIAASQLKHVFGVNAARGDNFLETMFHLIGAIPQSNVYVLSVALITLVSAVVMKKWIPKIPYMLIAMIIGSGVGILLGGETHGITLVGEMPAHLPPFHVPNVGSLSKLAGYAFAVALLGLIEAVAIGRSIAVHTHQRINGNQEFIGQGLSNLIGSFFSCYAGSGSFTRSGVNYQAGAKTPLAAIFAALLLMLVVLFVAPLTAYLPIPAMGGIILLVAYNLIDFKQIRSIYRASRSETAVLGITFFSTLLFELEFAIYAGVLLSLFFYLRRTSQPNIALLAPDPADGNRHFTNLIRKKELQECPQMRIVRIDGSLFYGAVDHIDHFFTNIRAGREKICLIIASSINFIDLAGAEWLVHEAEKWKARGGGLYLAGLKRVSQTVLEKGGFKEAIGPDHFFATKKEAVAALFDKVDQLQCQKCTARIFQECEGVEAAEKTRPGLISSEKKGRD